ncbi:MAG: helix-turn-helix domain-containing protein [Cyanobacteriota bacterium]|jgi:AraC-like DNA-binding protein
MNGIVTTLLETREFEEWENHLSQAIGHHRSSLLTPELPFFSRMQVARGAGVSVVALEGRSSVRLHRHQNMGQAVLWLPQSGWVEETLNGSPLVAEPGTAMLCLPGDELVGETSPYLKGFSVILPLSLLGGHDRWRNFPHRHLAQGSEVVTLLQIARELIATLVDSHSDPSSLVTALADQLLYWRSLAEADPSDRILGPIERRRLLGRAREWMEAHLAQPFRISDLASALHVSTRSLQYCFREELGRAPLEEARRLRFRRLRQELRTTPVDAATSEALFEACGLTFSSSTHRQYLEWCGETVDHSRAYVSGRCASLDS